MKFIRTCDKDKSCCVECINNSKSGDTQKALRIAFLDLPKWTPCDIYEEDETDRKRHKEVQDFLDAINKHEKESLKFDCLLD